MQGNWLVIHTSYIDLLDATRDRVFEEWHLMIDIDTYMT
jgi:hypothetical protein